MNTGDKKNVLITGATGNVGNAAVERFLQDDYNVIAIVSPGKKTTYGYQDRVDTREADLADESATADLVRGIVASYGKIHAALLTAGGFDGGTLQDTDMKKLDRLITLNFKTAFNVARPVFLQMQQQGGGRIILFGARAGISPADGKKSFAYSLSKSLIFSMAEMLNAEGGLSNVVTSVIVPGTIDTPQNREAMPSGDFSSWVPPEDIAGMMAFLCSDKGDSLREPILKMYGPI